MSNYYSRSPPPLQHPVPTHPAYIPDPGTPSSPDGYKRFTSSPSIPTQQPGIHQQQQYNAPYPQPPPMQQQAHPQAPPMFNTFGGSPQNPDVPNFAAWGMNDATAQLGMQLGHSAVAAGQDYVQKNFGGLIPLSILKHHFNVSSSYVARKLQLLLFPWRHKPWSRRILRPATDQQPGEWQSPREDINSPDLYIPLMALVTYILLAALHSGLRQRFNPEILGLGLSKAIAVLTLDFIVVKLGCYILNVPGQGQILDIIAYSGYKFVGVILALIPGLLNTGAAIQWLVFLYAFASNGFFLIRALRSVILPDPASANASTSHISTGAANRRRRIIFLFLEALVQCVYMGILVRV